ncbi:MAG: Sugar transferases involved in lipopolysaccharide synthesis [Rhodobacteraceae bacterium HLUCCA08]|nr:MAG: Sugar transferases involved in lipopolysaccharide synthesis [Rhodobacteraceae bacterium HLUCCA08]
MTLHLTDLTREGAPKAVLAPVSYPLPTRSDGLYRNGAKRALDLLLVIVSAPFSLAVISILALAVMLGGHAPFYSQDRVGLNGRVFRIWKLRTMVHKADAKLEDYLAANPAARREWDSTQKLKDDPRITRVGRLLRKTSLDELPQLWNVINGTMSLVGPRPMMVEQQPAYPGTAYFRLRPGMTGLWQISDRNDTTFAGRAAYDERYFRDLSLRMDLGIILRTVAVVCRGTGY